MPVPEKVVKYVDQTPVDRMLSSIVDKLDDEINESDLNKIAVAAQVYSGIENYRKAATDMTRDALEAEEHNSARLGQHLVEKFGFRPKNCHAHAIVAGKHHYAARLRVRMAKLKIRIDDVDNGVWLPENTAATPHPAFPSAPPHSRIHRYNYYFWISSRLQGPLKEGVFRNRLKLIASNLLQGKQPDYVMMPKGVNLPGDS